MRRPRDSWIAAAGAILALAVLTRIYNAFAYAPGGDYDWPGHLINAFAFYEGRLPPLRSWLGFHPPLYYATSGALWHALPEVVPVHVGMRLVSAASGLGILWLLWLRLSRDVGRRDALVVLAFTAGVPVFAIGMSMLGNEMLCAFFATAVLYRLDSVPEEPRAVLRHAAGTALLAALAALTKSTGLVVLGIAGLAYLVQLRRRPLLALAAGSVLGAIPLALAGPVYARLILASDAGVMGVVTAVAYSPDVALIMSRQPPGVRELGDYFSFPIAALTDPRFSAPGMAASVPGLFWASLWGDVHWHFVWRTDPARIATAVVSIAGLLPTAIGAVGVAAMLQRRRPGELAALALAALLLLSLCRYAWMLPHYSAVKASYLLPAVLPGAQALGAALSWLPGDWRATARVVLLLVGLAGSALITYGWWWW